MEYVLIAVGVLAFLGFMVAVMGEDIGAYFMFLFGLGLPIAAIVFGIKWAVS
jgi:hypothetical protein